MNGAASPVALPVLLTFPGELARERGWGRLIALSSASARLSTLAVLGEHERVLLSFELSGERFKELAAEVLYAEKDADGYSLAELKLTDEVERRRLAKVLLDMLSR